MNLTDREWRWLCEYTRVGNNASEAATLVYGGTPVSVRAKGYKKKVKLKPILDVIDRKWQQFLVRTPEGHLRRAKNTEQIEREIDAYLKRLKRRMVRLYVNIPCSSLYLGPVLPKLG